MESWLVACALLAAHVQWEDRGFRQKDVRFLIELLTSWRWSADERRHRPALHNTQILRTLRHHFELGWIKSTTGKKQARYYLTRAGFMGFLSHLYDTALEADFATYSFLSYILQSYRDRLIKLIQKEGTSLPLPQRLEVERLLDGPTHQAQRQKLMRERLQYWQRRIKENETIVELVRERISEGQPIEKIVLEIERRYPYEMNFAKPLTAFISEVPKDLQAWELTEGQLRRARIIWATAARLLELEA